MTITNKKYKIIQPENSYFNTKATYAGSKSDEFYALHELPVATFHSPHCISLSIKNFSLVIGLRCFLAAITFDNETFYAAD